MTSGVLATEPATEVTLLEGTLGPRAVVSPTVMELGTESVELLDELLPGVEVPDRGGRVLVGGAQQAEVRGAGGGGQCQGAGDGPGDDGDALAIHDDDGTTRCSRDEVGQG